MKIKINEKLKDGVELSESQDAGSLDLARDDLKFISPILLNVFITKDQDDLYAHVTAKGRIEAVCGRCLCRVEFDFNKEFDFSYDVKGKTSLDITDDIRQEIILEYPLRLLCAPDCKGLCLICGKNLNEGNCGHKKEKRKR